MKRLVICLFVALVAVGAKAQDWYAGGTLDIWGGDDETSFGIAPEVGYNFNEKWAVGGSLLFDHSKSNGVKTNAFALAPYARYTFFRNDVLGLFVEGSIGFSTAGTNIDGDKNVNGFQIGFRPGFLFDVTEHFSLVTKIGFLGYRDDYYNNYQNGGGLTLRSSNLSIGFYYTF